MNFIFLRHAEYKQPKNVPSALLPHPLTAEGEKQAVHGAEKLIAFFKNNESKIPPYIECSSSLRAYETAKILVTEIKKHFSKHLKIRQTDALTERRLGPMANLTVDEIETVLNKDDRYENPPKGWKSSRNYKLPYIGCESLKEAGFRVAEHIKKAPGYDSEQKKGSLFRIIVGHGASFRHAAAELAILQEEDIPKLSMFYAEPLFFNCNNGQWKHIGGNWKVRGGNENID